MAASLRWTTRRGPGILLSRTSLDKDSWLGLMHYNVLLWDSVPTSIITSDAARLVSFPSDIGNSLNLLLTASPCADMHWAP